MWHKIEDDRTWQRCMSILRQSRTAMPEHKGTLPAPGRLTHIYDRPALSTSGGTGGIYNLDWTTVAHHAGEAGAVNTKIPSKHAWFHKKKYSVRWWTTNWNWAPSSLSRDIGAGNGHMHSASQQNSREINRPEQAILQLWKVTAHSAWKAKNEERTSQRKQANISQSAQNERIRWIYMLQSEIWNNRDKHIFGTELEILLKSRMRTKKPAQVFGKSRLVHLRCIEKIRSNRPNPMYSKKRISPQHPLQGQTTSTMERSSSTKKKRSEHKQPNANIQTKVCIQPAASLCTPRTNHRKPPVLHIMPQWSTCWIDAGPVVIILI